MSSPDLHAAEVCVPSSDLAADVAFFEKRLGFRLDTIFPADDPVVATMSGYGLRVRLVVDGLEVGHVHELTLPGVRSAGRSAPILHPVAYYTLWNIPK